MPPRGPSAEAPSALPLVNPYRVGGVALVVTLVAVAASIASTGRFEGASPLSHAMGWMTLWALAIALAPLPHALAARPKPGAALRQSLVLLASLAGFWVAIHGQFLAFAPVPFRRDLTWIGLGLGIVIASLSVIPLRVGTSRPGVFARALVALAPVLGSARRFLQLSGIAPATRDRTWALVASFPVLALPALSILLHVLAPAAPAWDYRGRIPLALGLAAAQAAIGTGLLLGAATLLGPAATWIPLPGPIDPAQVRAARFAGSSLATLEATAEGPRLTRRSIEGGAPEVLPAPPARTTHLLDVEGDRFLVLVDGAPVLLTRGGSNWTEQPIRLSGPGEVLDAALVGEELYVLAGRPVGPRREVAWSLERRRLAALDQEAGSATGLTALPSPPVLAVDRDTVAIVLGAEVLVLPHDLSQGAAIDLEPPPEAALGFEPGGLGHRPLATALRGDRLALLYGGLEPALLTYRLATPRSELGRTFSPVVLRGVRPLLSAVGFDEEGRVLLPGARGILAVEPSD